MRFIFLALISTINCSLWRRHMNNNRIETLTAAVDLERTRTLAMKHYLQCSTGFLAPDHKICKTISYILS